MEAGDHNWTKEDYAAAFQQGNEQALAFIYRDFHPALAHYAHQWVQDRSIAEEIAAETLVKTWKMHWKLDSYGAIRAYLYKIVHRDSLRHISREKKRAAVHQQSKPAQTTTDTPFDHVVRSEVYRLIHTALKDLSPANRKVIVMHYLEGKTTGQIARELNVHPSTVKTQKNRGLQALRKQLMRPVLILFYFLVKFLLPQV
ncbi:MAG: sigma-70 family RNA polymerase sigma factor [Lacibacter sp.]|jgi:RNA polymerase sigma-70 factor (ECF subfamily)|nr:sigma-70 family RNA polymerase sigma factor [Ferruginibacter sp.]HMP20294.1 sigma-70 family RNA polymerase sigma factor [Ferruginibacter sp.]